MSDFLENIIKTNNILKNNYFTFQSYLIEHSIGLTIKDFYTGFSNNFLSSLCDFMIYLIKLNGIWLNQNSFYLDHNFIEKMMYLTPPHDLYKLGNVICELNLINSDLIENDPNIKDSINECATELIKTFMNITTFEKIKNCLKTAPIHYFFDKNAQLKLKNMKIFATEQINFLNTLPNQDNYSTILMLHTIVTKYINENQTNKNKYIPYEDYLFDLNNMILSLLKKESSVNISIYRDVMIYMLNILSNKYVFYSLYHFFLFN